VTYSLQYQLLAHTAHYVQPLPSRFWPKSGRFWPKSGRFELRSFLLVHLTHSQGQMSLLHKNCSSQIRTQCRYTSNTSKPKLAELDPEPSQPVGEPHGRAEHCTSSSMQLLGPAERTPG
jgi:hypothetical protein